eukprot:4936477-Karenia_brevis.AAC.1
MSVTSQRRYFWHRQRRQRSGHLTHCKSEKSKQYGKSAILNCQRFGDSAVAEVALCGYVCKHKTLAVFNHPAEILLAQSLRIFGYRHAKSHTWISSGWWSHSSVYTRSGSLATTVSGQMGLSLIPFLLHTRSHGLFNRGQSEGKSSHAARACHRDYRLLLESPSNSSL